MSWQTVDEILDPIVAVISLVVLLWVLVVVWRLSNDMKKGKRGG